MVSKPAAERVGGDQVDHRLAVRADGRQRLAAAVPLGPPGGEDDKREPAPARSAAHALQRKTALAQVIPPPNPVSSRLSPSCTRPSSSTSCRARGMEADEVLP